MAQSGQRVVVGGTKPLTSLELNDHGHNGMPLAAMNLCLVSVDTIYEPIAAIPDEGGTAGDFLFIRPAENWGYGFTQLIEDNEASELAELTRNDVNSDTTSNTDEVEEPQQFEETQEFDANASVDSPGNESSETSTSS